MEKLILQNRLAVGDCLVATTALRELHRQYPNKYQTDVISYYPEVFFNNPNITKFNKEELDNCIIIDMNYDVNYVKKNKKHFVEGYIDCINKKLKTDLKLNNNKPEINLTEQEIEKGRQILKENGINKPFWLMATGYKIDMPLKAYSPKKWQELINILNDKNICIVQTGDSKQINPRFKNIISLVGKTNDLRTYFSICYHSEGMLGLTSLQCHVAASFNKKCIILGGGRENIEFSGGYKNQIYFSSVGKLDCCKYSGCFKSKINECDNYISFEGAECTNIIHPEQIIDCVLNYENNIKMK